MISCLLVSFWPLVIGWARNGDESLYTFRMKVVNINLILANKNLILKISIHQNLRHVNTVVRQHVWIFNNHISKVGRYKWVADWHKCLKMTIGTPFKGLFGGSFGTNIWKTMFLIILHLTQVPKGTPWNLRNNVNFLLTWLALFLSKDRSLSLGVNL